MQRPIHWGTLITTSFLALVGAACSDGTGPAEGQAQYRTYRPPLSAIPQEYTQTRCYEAYAGIGAEIPLRSGAGVGVPEMPTGIEGRYPQNPGGPVQDGQSRQDGVGQYAISCTVSGSGDGPYRISADFSGPNSSPNGDSPSLTTLKISGAQVDADGKGTGQVTFYSFESKGVQPLPGNTCAIEVIPNPATGKRIIAPGSAFLVFKCDGVTTDGPGSYCHSEGTVVLGNCARD